MASNLADDLELDDIENNTASPEQQNVGVQNYACFQAKIDLPEKRPHMEIWLQNKPSSDSLDENSIFVTPRHFLERYGVNPKHGPYQLLVVGVTPVGLSKQQKDNLKQIKLAKFNVEDLDDFKGWAMAVCWVEESAIDHQNERGENINGQIHYRALQRENDNVIARVVKGDLVFFFDEYLQPTISVKKHRVTGAAKNIQDEIRKRLHSARISSPSQVVVPGGGIVSPDAGGKLTERPYSLRAVDERYARHAPKGIMAASLTSLFVLQHDTEFRTSNPPDLTIINLLPGLIRRRLPGVGTADYLSNIQEQFFDKNLELHAIAVPDNCNGQIEFNYPDAAGSDWDKGRVILCMHMRKELERGGLQFTVNELVGIHRDLEMDPRIIVKPSEAMSFFTELRQALDVEKSIDGSDTRYWSQVDTWKSWNRSKQTPRKYLRDTQSTESIGDERHVSHEQVVELLATTTKTILREIANLSEDHLLDEFGKLGPIAMPGNMEQLFDRMGNRLNRDQGNEAIRDGLRFIQVSINRGRAEEGQRISKVADLIEKVTLSLKQDASRQYDRATINTCDFSVQTEQPAPKESELEKDGDGNVNMQGTSDLDLPTWVEQQTQQLRELKRVDHDAFNEVIKRVLFEKP